MTRHVVSHDSLHPGESPSQWFRRVGREKPGKYRGCHWCKQDHRGPPQSWAPYELDRHLLGVWEYTQTDTDTAAELEALAAMEPLLRLPNSRPEIRQGC